MLNVPNLCYWWFMWFHTSPTQYGFNVLALVSRLLCSLALCKCVHAVTLLSQKCINLSHNQNSSSGMTQSISNLLHLKTFWSHDTGEVTREFLLFTRFMDYVGKGVARRMTIFANHLELLGTIKPKTSRNMLWKSLTALKCCILKGWSNLLSLTAHPTYSKTGEGKSSKLWAALCISRKNQKWYGERAWSRLGWLPGKETINRVGLSTWKMHGPGKGNAIGVYTVINTVEKNRQTLS